jgi:hypothetical protein
VQLAHRSQRLLARGRLLRDGSRRNAHVATVGGEVQEYGCSYQAAGVRQSRLINAIQSRAIRSDSIRTTSESSASIESHLSDDLPTKPYSSDFIQRSTSISSLARQNICWEHPSTTPRSAHPIIESREKTLYTLVLLASPTFDPSSHHDQAMLVDSWNLLEGMGISCILQVGRFYRE